MNYHITTLEKVAIIGAGQSAPKDNMFSEKNGLSFIRAGHLESLISGAKMETLPTISSVNAKSNKLKVLKKGSILFAKSGMSAMMNRVYLTVSDAYYVSHLASVTPNPNLVDPKFCYYFLQFFKTSKLIKDSAYPSIGLPDIAKVEIPLPPLPIQKRIAEILDAADALKRKGEQLLKKYDELAQAIFIDMFGDPVKNEKGWDIKTIDKIAKKVTDGDHLTPIRSESGYKLLSCRNVKNGYIDFEAGLDFVEEREFQRMYKRCNPEKGDILVSCSGTIGRVTQIKIDEKFVLVRSAALIKPDYNFIVPTYLEYFLQTDFMQREMHKSSNTSSQANLFTGPIKALPVLIPVKKLQEKFAAKIQILESAKNITLTNISLSNNLFNSLIQKAFNGELVN